MAAGKLSHIRGTGPLLRLVTLVTAAITVILLGAAWAVARSSTYGVFTAEITIPYVSDRHVSVSIVTMLSF